MGFFSLIGKYDFNLAIEQLWKEIKDLDSEISKDKPWSLNKKDQPQYLKKYVTRIVCISHYLKIFLPDTAGKIEKQFTDSKIKSEKSLFPRLS